MERTTLHGVINGVTRKDLTRNSDGKPFTVWDVETTVGRISAGRPDLAQKAMDLQGESAYFDVSVKENGAYTNYYLNAIKEDHQTSGGADYSGGRWPEQNGQTHSLPSHAHTVPHSHPHYSQTFRNPGGVAHESPLVYPDAPDPNPRSSAWTQKDYAIWRQTATKVAALTSKTPQEFWANVDDMMLFYEHGKVPAFATSDPAVDQIIPSDIPF